MVCVWRGYICGIFVVYGWIKEAGLNSVGSQSSDHKRGHLGRKLWWMSSVHMVNFTLRPEEGFALPLSLTPGEQGDLAIFPWV